MTLLEVDGLTLVRGGRLLLEGLDFTLLPGEAILVTGPNGVGKSSLLRCLAGLLPPVSGRVTSAAELALADDRLPLDPELPLGAALDFWAGFVTPSSDVASALRSVSLEALAKVPVRMLSSGQRKRAGLALAVMSRAPVWLLDEPLNALDEGSIGQVEALISTHREMGGSIVAASHTPLGGDGWRRLALG